MLQEPTSTPQHAGKKKKSSLDENDPLTVKNEGLLSVDKVFICLGLYSSTFVEATVTRAGVIISCDRHVTKLTSSMVNQTRWVNLSHVTFVKVGNDTYATLPFVGKKIAVTLTSSTLKLLYVKSLAEKTPEVSDSNFMKVFKDVLLTMRKVSLHVEF